MSQTSTKNKMSLLMLTASVAGTMMGSGIFILPATLAGIGSISIFGWLLSLFGVFGLALVFSKLSILLPKSGGPYAYTRKSYGNYLGFQTAFVYWIASWIGNIAVAIVLTGYLSDFFPALKDPTLSCIVGIAVLWFFLLLNLYGPRFMGHLQIFTSTVMLIPLMAVVLFGWFWFDKTTFLSGFRVDHISTFDAISRSAAMTLWAFLGIETATVNAGVVENPARTIPIATLLGASVAGCVYICTSVIIMGIIPASILAQSSSPFSLLAQTLVGPKMGAFISICAIIACLGSISGWSLVIGQVSKAIADDNLFPKFFGRTNKYNAPYLGLLFSGFLMAALFLLTLTPSISHHFTIISEAAVFMVLLPYLYSCASLFIMLKQDSHPYKEKILYSAAAIVGILYSFWAIIGLGKTIIFYGTLIMLLTVVCYLYPVLKKNR